MINLPLVSIIIPCRNEERFISKCLDSIITNNYPEDRLEILVIDGISEDGTREIIKEYSKKYLFIKLLDNPERITSVAMNIGIKNAKGDIVIILSAHSIVAPDFVAKNVKYLQNTDASCVGGTIQTIGTTSLTGKAITLALSSPFGVGNAMFRIGVTKPTYVDTVPFGAYRKEVFDRIGFFDEELIRNQDIEFNLRLKKIGGKILLAPDIVSYYYARSNLKSLAKNNFQNGFWVIYSMKFAKLPFSTRHLVPFVFVSSLIGSLTFSIFFNYFLYLFTLITIIYFILNLFFSFKISLKEGINYLFQLILSFATLHFSYGLGSVCGIIKLIISKGRKENV